MRRSTQAKYDFVKSVLTKADQIISKKKTLNPTTAIGIAFIALSKDIVAAAEASKAKEKPQC